MFALNPLHGLPRTAHPRRHATAVPSVTLDTLLRLRVRRVPAADALAGHPSELAQGRVAAHLRDDRSGTHYGKVPVGLVTADDPDPVAGELGEASAEPLGIRVARIDEGNVRLECLHQRSERIEFKLVETAPVDVPVDRPGRQRDRPTLAEPREERVDLLPLPSGELFGVSNSGRSEGLELVLRAAERPDDEGSEHAAAAGLVDPEDPIRGRGRPRFPLPRPSIDR